jgi:hypothetical protein
MADILFCLKMAKRQEPIFFNPIIVISFYKVHNNYPILLVNIYWWYISPGTVFCVNIFISLTFKIFDDDLQTSQLSMYICTKAHRSAKTLMSAVPKDATHRVARFCWVQHTKTFQIITNYTKQRAIKISSGRKLFLGWPKIYQHFPFQRPTYKINPK